MTQLSSKIKDVKPEELVTPGEYLAKVEHAKDRVSRAGNDTVSLLFVIEEGEFKDRALFHSIRVEPDKDKERRAIKQMVVSFGLDGEKIKSYNSECFPGRECMITVGIKEKTKDFDRHNAITGFRPLPASKSAKK